MERQKAKWLESERHYLHSIIHGCRELRHYLLPLYDSCNTAEFFWSVETILSACYKADRGPGPNKPADKSHRQKVRKRDEDSSDDSDNEDDDRVDMELLKMPLMKLLKMELEALFKLTRERKKLLQYFSASNPEIESRVFNERKELKMETKILEKTQQKLPKYQTLLEYQAVLGCCIMEKFSCESVFFAKTYHTLLTLRFNTLQAFVLRLSSTCQEERNGLSPVKEAVTFRDKLTDITEIPRFPYFKYFTRAYGNGFIDSKNYWSEVMSLMVATIKRKRRPRETKPIDENDAGQDNEVKQQEEVLPTREAAIEALENDPSPEPNYGLKVLKVVKEYKGCGPNNLPLTKGPLVKQTTDTGADGMAFDSKESLFYSKKKPGFYPTTHVTPQKSN